MTKGKKYNYRIKQHDQCWTAEIIRKVTSKKTTVSKKQEGFASESEAQKWAEETLKEFLQNLNDNNKRRSAKQK